MDRDRYVERLRGDGVALAEAIADSFGRAVPSCPGWNVQDLVWHVAEVHRFWEQIVSRRLLDPEEVERPIRPDDSDLLVWYEGRLADLLEALGTTDPDTLVWSWAAQEPVPALWVDRRMAVETAIHRWDAQDAVGRNEPIATDLAVDGIEEFLLQFVAVDPSRIADGAETVGFEASDTGDAWVARVAHGALEVRAADRNSSLYPLEATARGTASDLLLVLWRRRRQQSLEVRGDRAALARFLIRAHLG